MTGIVTINSPVDTEGIYGFEANFFATEEPTVNVPPNIYLQVRWWVVYVMKIINRLQTDKKL